MTDIKLAKLVNNKPINYSLKQLLIDYPDAVIYKDTAMPDKELLANYDAYHIVTTPPNTGKYEVLVGEGDPIFENNEWYQTWVNRPMTDDERLEVEKNEDAESFIVALRNEETL